MEERILVPLFRARQLSMWLFKTSLRITIATALLSAPVYGAVIKASLDPSKFGTLDQANTNFPCGGCGPTAAVNSFVYLQNAFPKVYPNGPLVPTVNGNKPTQAEQAAVANNLGRNFMNTSETAGGTVIEDFILGKRNYLEQRAPGKTVYSAQIGTKWASTAPKPDFVQETNPTLAFLAQELKKGEDVEVALANRGAAHFLTLTGIEYDDTTNRGTISFINPNGGQPGTSQVRVVSDTGIIRTDFIVGSQVGDIINAVSESPVPEPGIVLLQAAGLACLLVYCRRRKAGRWAAGRLAGSSTAPISMC